ncbi:MAG: hypothetical protein GY870_06375 [archaeon]|nr:hypothetical protein [archaeon]
MKLPVGNEFISEILRNVSEGIISINNEGLIVLINEFGEMLTRCSAESIIGKHYSDFFIITEKSHQKVYQRDFISTIFMQKEDIYFTTSEIEITQFTPKIKFKGLAIPVRDNTDKLMGINIIFEGEGDKLENDEQFARKHRIESLGYLIDGIAHDFNNIFTSILGNISLAKMDANKEEEIYSFLNEAESSVEKARKLTHQLLILSKEGKYELKPASISELIRDCSNLALSGSNVGCKFYIDEDLSPVRVNYSQISQAINNLVVNAAEAMPNGGIIEISAKNVILEEHGDIPVDGGKYVKITVKDHGIGIPEEDFFLIFEPFFTTKDMSNNHIHAKGLGLTIVQSIINQYGGYLDINSQVGRGTTVIVYLPVSGVESKLKPRLI